MIVVVDDCEIQFISDACVMIKLLLIYTTYSTTKKKRKKYLVLGPCARKNLSVIESHTLKRLVKSARRVTFPQKLFCTGRILFKNFHIFLLALLPLILTLGQ